MEEKLDKLESYLRDYYLDIDNNIYLLLTWILDNRMYVVPHLIPRSLHIYLSLIYMEDFKIYDAMGIPELLKIKILYE